MTRNKALLLLLGLILLGPGESLAQDGTSPESDVRVVDDTAEKSGATAVDDTADAAEADGDEPRRRLIRWNDA